jgi:hypothetical protein
MLTHCGWLALGLALVGCSGSGHGNIATITYTARNSYVQKGPFVRYSPITVQELDQNLSPNGRAFNYETNTGIGTFSPNDKFETKYISLTASGDYFDEIANAVSTDPVTLNAYADLGASANVNINILTTLAYHRIQTLVSQSNLSFDAARDQAAKEILAAFKIRNIGFINFNALDISDTGDNNNILLAISSVFLQAATTAALANNTSTTAELTQLIAGFSNDIADNGVIDDSALTQTLASASQSVDVNAVASNLNTMYRSLVNVYNPIAPADLVKWLDRDGDGVIEKNKLVQANATPGTAYTSTAYIAGADDNAGVATLEVVDPSTADYLTLTINGTKASSGGAVVHTGNKITITVTLPPKPTNAPFPVGTLPLDAVSAYLKINSTRVEKYTVVTAPIQVTLATQLERLGSPSGIAVSNDSKTLFIASMPTVTNTGVQRDDGGLYIYDVTTVSRPNLLKLEQDPVGGLPAGYYGVVLSDDINSNTAYIANSQQEMQVLDLTDLANPVVTSRIGTVSQAMSIVQATTALSTVFVGTSGYNVKLIGVTDQTNPSLNEAYTQPVNSQPWGLTISPDDSQLIAYSAMSPIADEMDILVDTSSTPPTVRLGGAISIANILPAGVTAAAYCGNKELFVVGVSGSELSFATADLGSPGAPNILGQGVTAISAYDGSGIGVSFSAATHMAYVVVMGELFLIDLTDLSKPMVRGSLILPPPVASSSLPLPPRIAASADGASVYVSWNGWLFVLQVGN